MNARQVIEAESPKSFLRQAGEQPPPGWGRSGRVWTYCEPTTYRGYLGDLGRVTVYGEALPFRNGHLIEVTLDHLPYPPRKIYRRDHISDPGDLQAMMRRLSNVVADQHKKPVGLNELENLFRDAIGIERRPLPDMG